MDLAHTKQIQNHDGSSQLNLDDNGNIYFSRGGEYILDNGTKTIRSILIKYNSNGVEMWKSVVLDKPIDSSSSLNHLHHFNHNIVDATGNVFVHSVINGNYPNEHVNVEAITKYSSDGMRMWEEKVDYMYGGLSLGKNREVYLFDQHTPTSYDHHGNPSYSPPTNFYLKLR